MSTDAPVQPSAAEQPEAISVRYDVKTPAIRRYTTGYALGSLGISLLYGAALLVLLPLHVQQLEFAQVFTGANAHVDLQALTTLKEHVDAHTVTPTAHQRHLLDLLAQYNSGRVGGLSLITSVGVFVTMLIQPLVGMFSDRTRSRLGRRAPYIVAGAVAGGALVAVMPFAPTLAILVIVWSLVQLLANVIQGPLGATVPDRVPEERVGGISAITGLISYIGAIGGSIVAGALFTSIGLAVYFPIALIMLVLPIVFVLIAKDKSSKGLVVPRLKISTVFKSYVIALADHDFRWAWIAKVVLYVGYGIATIYSIYMLQSYVTPALSADEAAKTAPLLQFTALPATLIAMYVSGKWSDRIQRRKPFVIAASLIMAVSYLVPFAWHSVPAMFIQAIVAGFGFGTFIVVDQALFISVLPDRAAAGRDLGVSTLGQNLGQAIGPVLAGAAVAVFGGSYIGVWPVACVIVLIAAFAVIPIKRVR